MRCAVVIGVRKTGKLPPLGGAVSGATRVHDWLKAEGFQSELVTDVAEPVTIDRIETAVLQVVDSGTAEQLVIYFAGHGFLRHNSEFWLLSKAPNSSKEAVNVPASVELARRCGIPSVVIISDACRSTDGSMTAQGVEGAPIFPNVDDAGGDVTVDRLFAARPGEQALELVLAEGGRLEGLFTDLLLGAYSDPPPSLVTRLVPQGLDVITNRRLRSHFPGAALAKLAERKLPKRQEPQLIIESDEPVYVARADTSKLQFEGTGFTRRGSAGPDGTNALSNAAAPTRATPEDVARDGFGLRPLGAFTPRQLAEASKRSGMQREMSAMVAVQGRAGFETQTGLMVEGPPIAHIHGVRCDAERAGSTHVRVVPTSTLGSVVVALEDGRGFVVAVPTGYVAAVQVGAEGVAAVSYSPAQNGHRWYGHQVDDRLRQLRALAATAMRRGLLQLDRDEAATLADRIRVDKSVDPSLGLYAAYAYASAGARDAVESVANYMYWDLNGTFFDIAMLGGSVREANRKRRMVPTDSSVAPAVPMLAQGWALLAPSRFNMPKALLRLRRHVLNSLWTTYDPEGTKLLVQAAREGVLG